MLYRILKVIVRAAMLIFCRKIIINNRENLNISGPVLLACNHPNSFLDAVIIDALFGQPVWSLARGDAFKKGWITRALKALRILPVYRTSEGVENLNDNYKTFGECIQIFRDDGAVLIFSEGLCVNEWHLRPLKKGTARLALKSWNENIPLNVLPVGINYSSFRKFGKNVFLNFGNLISKDDIDMNATEGLQYQQFNQVLNHELSKLVFEIDKNDQLKKNELLTIKQPAIKKIFLSVPSILGWIIHAPFYLPARNHIYKMTRSNDHFDSVMIAVLLLTYPFYLLLVLIMLLLFMPWHYALLIVMCFPLLAWAHVQVKKQV